MDIQRNERGAATLSIVCLISRLNEAFFDSLNRLDVDDYELVLVLDGVNKNDVLERLTHKEPSIVVDMQSEHVNKVNVITRRHRIASLLQIAASTIGKTTYTLLFEDDTVVDPSAYKTLKKVLVDDKRVAFATGVQMGRWGIPYLGVWKREANILRSVPYMKKGTFPVSASGMYFLLIRTELFRKATFQADNSFGPDVHFTLDITKDGMDGAVVYDVVCGHIVNNKVFHPHRDCVQVSYRLAGKQWEQMEVPPFRNILGGEHD